MLTAYPETITARLDDTMLERVTRMYKADAADAFAELLQNARRAGASHVEVDLTSNLPSSKDGNPEARIQVTVTDDGSGIDDPQVILAYGRNGWTSETTTSEDAAGMGLLALAAIGCNITSWSKGAAKAWQTTLEPAHFQGQKPATIQTTKAPSSTSGTRIMFTLKTSLNTVSAALQAQAEFFPLPVHLTCQNIPQPLTQRPFLDASKPSETYQGVAYAVMDTYRTYNGTPPKDLNFHGITLHANLPTLTDAWKHRYETCADVHECSALKLVLPGRKDVVENDFLHNLRIHLNHTLLQAISDDPNGDLTHAQYKRAKTFTTPVAARPQLHRWHPTNARDDTPFHTSRPEPLPSDAILIACDDEYPTAFDQSLSRVLRKHPLNLYKPNPYLSGYDWFNNLPVLADCRWTFTLDGHTYTTDNYPVPDDETSLPQRPDRITCELAIDHPDGTRRTITVDTDIYVHANEYASLLYYGNVPIVAQNAKTKAHELANILVDAFYYPSDDVDSDAWDTQESAFRNDAYAAAVHTLENRSAADKQLLGDTAYDALFHLRPVDVPCAIIRIYANHVAVDFTDEIYEKPTANPQPDKAPA